MSATRKGKVARLPHEIREQLKGERRGILLGCPSPQPSPRSFVAGRGRRRLQNGELGKSLVERLNSLPEARAVLAADFGGKPITKQNLSEWKKGGYHEWLRKQESIEVAGQFATEAGELLAAGGSLTDKLAVWLAARYVVAACNLGRANGGKMELNVLHALCNDVVALRRGDHDAQRLEIERKRMELANLPAPSAAALEADGQASGSGKEGLCE